MSAGFGFVMKSFAQRCRSVGALQAESRGEQLAPSPISRERSLLDRILAQNVLPASIQLPRFHSAADQALVTLLASVARSVPAQFANTTTSILSPLEF